MKVGILTLHRSENFGAALQAYALQEFLTGIGHDAKIIDYRCSGIEKMYSLSDLSFLFKSRHVIYSLKRLIKRQMSLKSRISKKAKYNKFWHDYLKTTDGKFTEKILNDFDAIIVGSDQVWNPRLTNGLDPIFFLNTKNFKGKKISYAASSETYCFKQYVKNSKKLSVFLRNFDVISVREKSFAEELSKYTDKKIDVVLDPTFLFSTEFYMKLVERQTSDKYVLVYHLYETEKNVDIAKKIAKAKGLSIIEIHVDHSFTSDQGIHIKDAGPLELLSYIYFAEYVVTTSFHGVALSVNLQKEFYSVDVGSNARQKALFASLGLEDRLISGPEVVNLDSNIDYSSVAKRLEKQVEYSKMFLLNSLKSRVSDNND